MRNKANEESLRSSIAKALFGEVFPDIRAIAYAYDAKKKLITMRWYLSRPPVEEDYEDLGSVMNEVMADFSYKEFDDVKEECIYTTAPASELDPLDGLVYLRKE